MHVATSQLIIQQHHVHGYYFYNCVLFVFYYSPKVFNKNNNSFHFRTSVIVVCEIRYSTTASFSILSNFASTVHRNPGRIILVLPIYKFNNYCTSNRRSNALSSLITDLQITPNFCFPEHLNYVLTHNNSNPSDVNNHKQICTICHFIKRQNTGYLHAGFMKIPPLAVLKCNYSIGLLIYDITKKNTNVLCLKFMSNDVTEEYSCETIRFPDKFDRSSSPVPKLYNNDCGRNQIIQIYCIIDLSCLRECKSGNTLIRNNCQRTKNDRRGYLLSKGNEPSLHKDGQSVNDMSKVERHACTGKTATLTLNHPAFLVNIKRSYTLMNTLIRSSSTQAQCARHPCRQKEVRL